jgi:hypothetical protein
MQLWRVYRKDINELPWYSGEYMTKECYVISKTWERAKGIAKDRYPSLFEDILKADVLVELADISKERVICSN